MEGWAGTHFFCAPEVLDKQRYNEKADIFSLGVLLLKYLANYEPFRDKPLGGRYPDSSDSVQNWMYIVDTLIEKRCDPVDRALLRGMLLRSPKKRWSATKCLCFISLDPNDGPEENLLIGLPWTGGPFTEHQIQRGCKRKYAELEINGVECDHVEPDGVDSDDASTIIEARPRTTVTHSDKDRLSDVCDVFRTSGSDTYIGSSVDDVPATPKTPYRGADEEEELPSVPCTPFVDEVAMFERVVNEPTAYDFANCLNEWDWDRSGGSQSLTSHTRTSKTSNRPNGNKRHERPPAQMFAGLKDAQPKNLDCMAELVSEYAQRETKPRIRKWARENSRGRG